MNAFPDFAVAFHIVRAGGLFNKPGFCKGQRTHPVDGFLHLPDLVGINHQMAVRAQHFTGNAQTANIVWLIAADFELDMVKTCVNCFLAETAQFFVPIAEPARRSGVARIAFIQQS